MKIKFFDDNLVGQNALSRYLDHNLGWYRNIENYDIGIYTDQRCFNSSIDSSKINYAWIIEPPIINGENYINICKNYDQFKYVFSYNTSLADKIPNFKFVPHGGTWLMHDDIQLYTKTKLISYIFSNKDWNPYHRMRHRAYNELQNNSNIDFYGSGCGNPIDFKITGLQDYMFSIVIENSIEDDYFTEKILDCFLSGTIPIYCGTKNITKYFDSDGIIMFDGSEDLPSIIQLLNSNFYEDKIIAITNNFHKAQQYIFPEKIIHELL